MSTKFGANFGETKYPGKAEELRAEKAEKTEYGVIKEPVFDYNSIRAAESKSPLDSDNTYNNVEEENKPESQVKKFVTTDDIIGETEDDIINNVDDKLEEAKAHLAVIDSYGYVDVIEKLLVSAQAKGDKKAMDDILDRVTIFTKQYQKLLGKHVPEDEEAQRVDAMFKEIMGEVAYIKDGESERAELLSDYKSPRDAVEGKSKGKKIYYAEGGRSGQGFLSQAEADRFKTKKKSIFSGLAKDLKAFNPFTRKMESIDKK